MGVGTNASGIPSTAMVLDATAGVALLAIQALEKRTAALLESVKALDAEVGALRAENASLRATRRR